MAHRPPPPTAPGQPCYSGGFSLPCYISLCYLCVPSPPYPCSEVPGSSGGSSPGLPHCSGGGSIAIPTWGSVQLSSVQSLSCVRLFATPWIAARQASLSITNSRSSLKLMSIESVMPSSHLILCCPLLLLPPEGEKKSSLWSSCLTISVLYLAYFFWYLCSWIFHGWQFLKPQVLSCFADARKTKHVVKSD